MCDCDLCKRDRAVVKRLRNLSPAGREFWESIYLELAHAELDRDVNKAVIDGSWPDADSLIAHARVGRVAAG